MVAHHPGVTADSSEYASGPRKTSPSHSATEEEGRQCEFLRVVLNGVTVQENVEVTGPTRAAPFTDERATGPLMIQGDHGPVAVRNIEYKSYTGAAKLSDLTYRAWVGEGIDTTWMTTRQPTREGTVATLSSAPAAATNRFAMAYAGTLTVPAAGRYRFTLNIDWVGTEAAMQGPAVARADLSIDGKPVIVNRGAQQGMQADVDLTGGKHAFALSFFKNRQYGDQRDVKLFIEGPGLERQPLHDESLLTAFGRPVNPIMVQPALEPVVLRSFEWHRGQKRAYVASVADPMGVHYSYDLSRGAPFYVWRGPFLETTQMWDDRGEDQSSRPAGSVVDLAGAPAVAYLSDANAAWPDSVIDEKEFRRNGYVLDKAGVRRSSRPCMASPSRMRCAPTRTASRCTAPCTCARPPRRASTDCTSSSRRGSTSRVRRTAPMPWTTRAISSPCRVARRSPSCGSRAGVRSCSSPCDSIVASPRSPTPSSGSRAMRSLFDRARPHGSLRPSCPCAALLLAALTSVGHAQRAENPTAARESEYYRMSTLPVPEGVVLEVGGLETMPDGRLAVATRRGDVWLVENPSSANGGQPHYTRFAQGLHEALGLAYRDGALYTTQRSELTRLRDTDGDGKADRYETVASWPLSGNYHEYSFGPVFSPKGEMFVTLNLAWIGYGESFVKWRGWMLKVGNDGTITPWATGFRSPSSFGFNLDGDLFYSENQGDWVGSGGISQVEKGDFMGNPEGAQVVGRARVAGDAEDRGHPGHGRAEVRGGEEGAAPQDAGRVVPAHHPRHLDVGDPRRLDARHLRAVRRPALRRRSGAEQDHARRPREGERRVSGRRLPLP